MHVFWERGYEAASVADLTAAMGITPPSLYTAFGDKEHLFLEAIEAYGRGPGGFGIRALDEEPTARRAIDRLLRDAATELTLPCHPLGCMMVTAATNCSVAGERVRAALAQRRAVGVSRIAERIQRGIDAGEPVPGGDAVALANFVATVYQGMSMQALDGASKQSLLATVEMAMQPWDTPVTARAAAAPDGKLLRAIREKRRLRFTYNGKPRLVEPQCYGIGNKGTELLRGHQIAGGSQREPLFDVAKIDGLVVLDERFTRPGPNFKRDDSAMKTVFCQL